MIRKAKLSDLENILKIIKEAQERMKESNLTQWQNNYPNKEILTTDINGGHTFVYVDKEILATMSVFNYEPTYEKIKGAWLNDNNYMVIHRIAVGNKGLGLKITDKFYKFIFDYFKVKDIRIDTHKKNIPMIKSLERNNFKLVGIIHVLTDSDNKRLAYHSSVE